MPLALATGGTAASATSRARATRCRPPCGASATTSRLLDDDALAAGARLAPFDAIVVGVRAFNTSERLRAAHAALMAYVEGGGTLVVQYNTNNRLAPLPAPLGPWPFDIGQQRVTDETAAVTFAPPNPPRAHHAQPLGRRDFDGWVQERGLYFADTWDPRYETPLAMHDPGEAPQPGGLLWARHGKGTFVYTGLAVLPAAPRRRARAPTGCSPTCWRAAREQMNGRLTPRAAPGPAARAEMHDAPPFLTWRAIYLLVVGALAAEIASGATLTVAYR